MKDLKQIQDWVNHIIDQKSNNNSFQRLNIQMKLMLKGIPVKNIMDNDQSFDLKELETLVKTAANEMNVQLPQTLLK